MTIASFFLEKVRCAAKKAIQDGSDIVPVEGGNGIVVVREDSTEGKSRLEGSGVVAERVVVSNIAFLVCNS